MPFDIFLFAAPVTIVIATVIGVSHWRRQRRERNEARAKGWPGR